MYRVLGLLTVVCLAASAFAAAPPWPLWDGHESIEQYAARVNLPSTQTLDLGNGVTLDLVLIPAGKFIMGTPVPACVDGGFRLTASLVIGGPRPYGRGSNVSRR